MFKRILVFLLLSGALWAQSTIHVCKSDVAMSNVSGYAKPVPLAQVTVCSNSGTGTPCTPQASIFNVSDGAVSQPLTADINGNYTICAVPGRYLVQVKDPATGNTASQVDTVIPVTPDIATTWTAAQTGPFIDKGGAVYNVLAYGAKGDGVTDDTTAFQNALNQVCTNGGTVAIPAATFKIATGLTVTACAKDWKLSATGTNSVLSFQGQNSGLYIHDTSTRGIVEGIVFGGTSGRNVYIYNSSFVSLFRNTFEFGGTVAPSDGGPRAGVWIQGGSDLAVEDNLFTFNGPQTGAASCTDKSSAAIICPAGYDFITNFNYFAGSLATSTTARLRFINNRIQGSNTQISVVGFNADHSEFKNNFVDQNNAYLNDTVPHAEGGQGYGINVYGNAHVSGNVSNWVSTARTSNVVTTTMTAASAIPYVVGQVVCVNATAGATNNTDFSGCFPVASISGSGGATPTFTWNQVASNDSTTSIDIVNAVQGTQVTGNHVRNAAGSCIYTQSMVDGNVSENQVENCGQMMPSTSVAQAGISVSGASNLTVNSNTVDTAISLNPAPIGGQTYQPDCITVALGYGAVVSGNTCTNFYNGITTRSGNGVTVSKNTLDGIGVGVNGIYSPAGSLLNRYVVDGNLVRHVTSVGVLAGSNTTGFGYGWSFTNNTIVGNTSATPLTYGLQITAMSRSVNILGNFILGWDNATASGRTITNGIYNSAINSAIRNNLVDSTASYGLTEFGTDNEWSGNILNNLTADFAFSNGVRIRAYNNQFGNGSTFAATTTIPASAADLMRFNNKYTNGASQGTCTLVAGTCTVSTHEIQTFSNVRLTHQLLGGTVGTLTLGTVTANTSFIVNSSNAADTSVVLWEIVH